MKHLKLLVDDSIIKYDPSYNFDGLFQGMTEPVKLDFAFSSEWIKRPKVVTFLSLTDKELSSRIIKTNKGCIIPTEVMRHQAFRVQVLGKDPTGIVRTTKCTIYLKGGRT